MIRPRRLSLAAAISFIFLIACAEEQEFPNDIPAVKATVGAFRRAMATDNPAAFDSISIDRELYGDLTTAFGRDSMAVLSWRIQNPLDSAHVTMIVSQISPGDSLPGPQYSLELFMRKQGDSYWIVAHRLRASPP